MSNPLISICIPTFNRATYLKRCIESIVGYRGDDIEIVIQDNCSPDNTEEVVRTFSDPRIKFHKNASNIGILKSFNSLIPKLSGKYIFVLTDDDALMPGAIDIVKKFIQANDPDLFKCDILIHLIKEKKVNAYSFFDSTSMFKDDDYESMAKVFKSSHVATGVCYKRSVLNGTILNENPDNWYPCMLIAGSIGSKVGYIAEPIAIHTWQNETFWGMDSEKDQKLKQSIEDGIHILSKYRPSDFIKAIVKSVFVNEVPGKSLHRYLSNKEMAIIAKRIKDDRKVYRVQGKAKSIIERLIKF